MSVENKTEKGPVSPGELIVFYGSMFSGKTGGLIDHIERQGFAGRKAIVVKPSNDNRYLPDKVTTHSGKEIDAFRVNKGNPFKIFQLIKNFEKEKGFEINIVGIDEAQFFDKSLTTIVEKLLNTGRDVVVAGLPTDFRDEPFGPVPIMIASSDESIHKFAICTHTNNGEICGGKASKTQRIIDGEPADYNDPVVLVGGNEFYEGRCRKHHDVPGKPEPDFRL